MWRAPTEKGLPLCDKPFFAVTESRINESLS